MLQYKSAAVKPVVENLTPQHVSPDAPTKLVALRLQMIVTELLHVEIVHLERSMRRARCVVQFRALEEERVVVRVLEAAVDVEEGGAGPAADVDDVRNRQRQRRRVPLQHVVEAPVRIGDAVVPPFVHRRRAGRQPLERAHARLGVLEVDNEFLQVRRRRRGRGLALAPDQVDLVADGIGEGNDLTSARRVQRTDGARAGDRRRAGEL